MGINAADRSGDIRGGTGMTRKEAVKFAEHAVNMTDIPEVKEFYRMAAVALAPPNEALTCEGSLGRSRTPIGAAERVYAEVFKARPKGGLTWKS